MPTKKSNTVDQGDILVIKASPKVEEALASQMKTVPHLVFESAQLGAAGNCMGLVVCCLGASVSKQEQIVRKKN